MELLQGTELQDVGNLNTGALAGPNSGTSAPICALLRVSEAKHIPDPVRCLPYAVFHCPLRVCPKMICREDRLLNTENGERLMSDGYRFSSM